MAAPTVTKLGSGSAVTLSTLVITTSVAHSAGHTIVVEGLNRTSRNISSVTDSAGNTYTAAISVDGPGGFAGGGIFHCLNPANALPSGGTITITWAGGTATGGASAYSLNATCTYVASSGASTDGNGANPSLNTGASIPVDSVVFGNIAWGTSTDLTAPTGWAAQNEVTAGSRRFECYSLDVSSAGVKAFQPGNTGTANDYFLSVAAYTAPAASGASGTLAATETGADTFAGSGSVLVSGTLAASETGSDTFAASGSVEVAGTLAATEAGSDSFAGTGAVEVSGGLAATEAGSDTFAASGTVTDADAITGSLAAVEGGQDTLSATGEVAEAPAAPQEPAPTYYGSGRRRDDDHSLGEFLDELYKLRDAVEAGEPKQAAQKAAAVKQAIAVAPVPVDAAPLLRQVALFEKIVEHAEHQVAARQQEAVLKEAEGLIAIARQRLAEEEDEDALLLLAS